MSYNYKTKIYPDGTVEHRIFQGCVREEREKCERVRWMQVIDEETGEIKQVDSEYPEQERSHDSIQHSNRASKNRSKNMIIEYARANTWEWFCTFTFNPDLVDSFDYKLCYQKLYQWLNNLQKRKAPDVKYLGVPEQHKSGRWHFHVLMADCDGIDIVPSPKSGVYNVNGWKYGFSTATAVRDTKRVSTYITKYITKDLIEHTQGQHRYIKSRNLEKASDMTYQVDVEELEQLKIQLLAKGCHFKDVATPCYGHVIYIQEEVNNE